jgi:hypothetical protein
MALSKKRATTIALDPRYDRLLTRAARERGVSRSEFIRQQLALVLEQYRRHPKPRSAGVLRALAERGDERELFGGRRYYGGLYLRYRGTRRLPRQVGARSPTVSKSH